MHAHIIALLVEPCYLPVGNIGSSRIHVAGVKELPELAAHACGIAVWDLDVLIRALNLHVVGDHVVHRKGDRPGGPVVDEGAVDAARGKGDREGEDSGQRLFLAAFSLPPTQRCLKVMLSDLKLCFDILPGLDKAQRAQETRL